MVLEPRQLSVLLLNLLLRDIGSDDYQSIAESRSYCSFVAFQDDEDVPRTHGYVKSGNRGLSEDKLSCTITISSTNKFSLTYGRGEVY